jgi:hypothetical protein
MRETLLIIAAVALYVVVCHLDYQDAQAHEQAQAAYWADIREANREHF